MSTKLLTIIYSLSIISILSSLALREEEDENSNRNENDNDSHNEEKDEIEKNLKKRQIFQKYHHQIQEKKTCLFLVYYFQQEELAHQTYKWGRVMQ